MVSGNNYLCHYAKGSSAKEHKYVRKEKKNGKFVYYYNDAHTNPHIHNTKDPDGFNTIGTKEDALANAEERYRIAFEDHHNGLISSKELNNSYNNFLKEKNSILSAKTKEEEARIQAGINAGRKRVATQKELEKNKKNEERIQAGINAGRKRVASQKENTKKLTSYIDDGINWIKKKLS